MQPFRSGLAGARPVLAGAMLAAGMLAGGCVSTDDGYRWFWEQPQVDNARLELAAQQAQREAALSRNQIDGLVQSRHVLDERLDRLEAATRDNARLRDDVAALRRDLDQVRNDRETMRKEIVDDLTTRINKYMAEATATAAHNATVTQPGYRHKVEAGQKLADIAKAYKTTPAAIMKANNLKDSNLRVGTILFIPEPVH